MYNSLDALCKRFKISLAEREKHGALIDTRLLSMVYLELQGGKERGLDFTVAATSAEAGAGVTVAAYGPRPRPLASRATAEELAAHLSFVDSTLKDQAIWFARGLLAKE
jgi:DNA polymerase-3 subunit epsilon